MTSLIILVTPVHGKSLRWCKCHKSFITTGIFKKKNLRWMDIDAKRLYFGPKICVFNLPKGAEFLTPPEAFKKLSEDDYKTFWFKVTIIVKKMFVDKVGRKLGQEIRPDFPPLVRRNHVC